MPLAPCALCRLLMAQWRLCSEHAPPAPEPAGEAEAPGGGGGGGDADSSCATRGPSMKRLLRGMSSLMHREPSTTGSPTRRSTNGGELGPHALSQPARCAMPFKGRRSLHCPEGT